MRLPDLKSQIYNLSVSDRLEFLTAIAHSLQNYLTPTRIVKVQRILRNTNIILDDVLEENHLY
ncbi:MAG: hypothetical protein V7L05_29405 [Nostoc sp.]|uniref:hypothetical protein n=1 Tax=Nostoc sp. TaxID=1180 RepID=UPI002FF66B1B